jgi:hypothetical protein
VLVPVSLFPEIEQREAELAALEKVTAAAAIARLREREADLTPRFVARAVVEAVLRAIVSDRRTPAACACLSIVGGPYTIWPSVAEANSDEDIGSLGPWTDGHGGPTIWSARADRRRVIRVLDICAGAGVWSSEVRRFAALLGFDVWITAVDYEPDERQWLLRHADEVIIGEWQEALGMVQRKIFVKTMTPAGCETEVEEIRWVWGERRKYDLIIGNPAFSHARAATRAGWPEASGPPKKEGGPPTVTKAEARRRKHLTAAMVAAGEIGERAEYDTAGSMPALCLECAPAVVLYASQQCYTKTSSGWLTRLDYPYAIAYDVPSSVGHRGRGEGQDDKPYTAFVWLRGRGEPTATFMLPPIDDRNWDMRPGTEPDEWLTANGIPWLRSAA